MTIEQLLQETKQGIQQREEWASSDLFEAGYLEAMKDFKLDLERARVKEQDRRFTLTLWLLAPYVGSAFGVLLASAWR
jgi:hypothetical protein